MSLVAYIETSAWSLLDDDPSKDKTGKKATEKRAMEQLIQMYEKDGRFEIVTSKPVMDELNKSPEKNRTALQFIKKHRIRILEHDIFYGFILGSSKHGILGKSTLGCSEHPELSCIRSVKTLKNPKQSADRYILEHVINNDVLFITFNTRHFDKPEIAHRIRLPSRFLEELKSINCQHSSFTLLEKLD